MNKAIELFPEDIYLYNEKADYLLDVCDGYVEDNLSEFFGEIKSTIDRSLSINDTPYNRAWLLKCDYYKRANNNDIERQKSEIKQLVGKFSNIKTKNLAKAYQLYYKSLGFSEQKCEEELNNLFSYSKKTDDLRFVETCAIELMKYYMYHNKEKEYGVLVEKYKKEYIPSEDFNIIMAHAYLRYFSDFRKVEEIIRNGGESIMWKDLYFEYLCNTKQLNRAKEVRQKYFMNDPIKTIKFYSTFDDIKVIDYLEDYWETNPHTLSDISTYACACINHGHYEKAFSLCKKYFDKPECLDGTLYINYFLADKKWHNKDVSSRVKKKMIDNKELFSNIELAAAYALVKDDRNMYSYLNAAIKERALYKFEISTWPVFEDYRDEEKFKQLCDTRELLGFLNE